MGKHEYLKIGESKIVDGQVCIKPGYYDNGITDGHVFKDTEAYEKDWDAVCYVPELGYGDPDFLEFCVDEAGEPIDTLEDDGLPDADGFYHYFIGYTHNDLLDMCHGNRAWCDCLFYNTLDWAFPDTYLGRMDDEDIADFYSFIKPGAQVWWNDPAGKASGEYTVWGVPFEFNEHGELVEPLDWGTDVIIIIGNDDSEAEVTPLELTPIYK